MKNKFKTQIFRHGSYSVLLCVVVIAVALIINLAATQIPTKYSQIDMSANQLYSIGTQTTNLVSNLDTDINIYLLFQSSNESNSAATTLTKLLARYEDLSDHIKVSFVDPVTNPTFVSQYSSDSSSLSEGSVVVESEKRYKTISLDSIYVTDYSSYYTTGTATQDFDGENQITSAIDYVTSDNLPVVYNVTGHGEVELPTNVLSSIALANLECTDLNLLSAGEVPEDCDALIINGPTSDFSSDEADMVLTYLEKGGSVFITTSYTEEELTEFNRIMADYGISTVDGIVMEGDSGSYYTYPMYFSPSVESHDITSPIVDSQIPVVLMQAKGLAKSETRSTVQVTDLLTTSDSAYSRPVIDGSLEDDSKDISGPFSLGVAITEDVDDANTTHMVVISCSYLLSSSMSDSYTTSNLDLFINSLSWMTEHESTISIMSKTMTDESILATTMQSNLFTMVFVIIIPLAIILLGLVVWFVRRRK
jgi:ABC-2 type transport system permease protein